MGTPIEHTLLDGILNPRPAVFDLDPRQCEQVAAVASAVERVARGVAWLDANKPGWVHRINVDDLDLRSCRYCVLGQVYGYFFGAPFFGELGDGDGHLFARSIGVYADTAGSGDGQALTAEINELTELWKRAVAERQAQR
jgi:hypothetical protein